MSRQPEVIITVAHGPCAGQSAVVAPEQSMLIGRLPECRLSIQADPTISRQHCQIEWRAGHWYLRNLSHNGTLLNGQSVQDAPLSDGDLIEIGHDTVLEARLVATSDLATRDTNRAAKTQPLSQRAPIAPIFFTAETCGTNLVALTGSRDEPTPSTVADALRQVWPLSLIVDLNKLPSPRPPELEGGDRLLSWAPANHSPVVVTEDIELTPLFEQAWGKNGLIAVFVREERDVTRKHLQMYSGAFIRPSILMLQLTETTPELAETLLTGLEAVLLEADSPGRWMLLTRDDSLETLSAIGFVREADVTEPGLPGAVRN